MAWLLSLMLLASGNRTIPDFREAKRLGLALHEDTFYCGCRISGRRGFQSLSCGYEPRINNVRARRIEWEHVVPASRLGQMFVEYREGHDDCVRRNGRRYRGRRCASKTNLQYRRILADLYNLRPTVGELNAARAAMPFGIVPGEARRYGRCDFEHGEVVEPRRSIRGDIARTYLYMATTYGMFLVKHERAMLALWSRRDPVDTAECRWARGVAAIQKNLNLFVMPECPD